MMTNENKAGNEQIVSLPASTKIAIELRDITKRFGHVVANSDVNLELSQDRSTVLLERMVQESPR